MANPKNPLQLFEALNNSAVSFGFKPKENGILRDCIHKSDGTKKDKNGNENNFWFGFIRDDQPESGSYDGLSYVVFPEYDGKYCMAGIGIGSNKNLGADINLASGIAFRRTFMRLKKHKPESECNFFFKTQFDELEEPTPGLQDEVEKIVYEGDTGSYKYDDCLRITTKEYNHGSRGGLLPAVMIVDYTTDDGMNLLKAWLAQYAKWRNWSSFKNGKEKAKQVENITNAINQCKASKETLTPEKVKDILMKRQFIVLQGAPGCGKTWTAIEVAKLQENEKKVFKETEFIQFHAETTYSEFIYGIKPVLDGEKIAYKGEKGTLLRILDKALADPDNNYLLIIDEFNRANLPNVLGPVFSYLNRIEK